MQIVKGYIASRQRELDAHPLLDQVRREEPGVLEQLAARLAFPVLALPDVVRDAAVRITDPTLVRIAFALCSRAAERERRFLRDLHALGVRPPAAGPRERSLVLSRTDPSR